MSATHLYAGSNPERARVGDPGHCERCAEVGHVIAHPGLGCGDVGCTRGHGPEDEPEWPPFDRDAWVDDQVRLEIRDQVDMTFNCGGMLLTPPIDEEYWSYRVKLGTDQAIVGFPKFTTVGIGFAREEDWNTNLPYTYPIDSGCGTKGGAR